VSLLLWCFVGSVMTFLCLLLVVVMYTFVGMGFFWLLDLLDFVVVVLCGWCHGCINMPFCWSPVCWVPLFFVLLCLSVVFLLCWVLLFAVMPSSETFLRELVSVSFINFLFCFGGHLACACLTN